MGLWAGWLAVGGNVFRILGLVFLAVVLLFGGIAFVNLYQLLTSPWAIVIAVGLVLGRIKGWI